jgi:hypothetical protein
MQSLDHLGGIPSVDSCIFPSNWYTHVYTKTKTIDILRYPTNEVYFQQGLTFPESWAAIDLWAFQRSTHKHPTERGRESRSSGIWGLSALLPLNILLCW